MDHLIGLIGFVYLIHFVSDKARHNNGHTSNDINGRYTRSMGSGSSATSRNNFTCSARRARTVRSVGSFRRRYFRQVRRDRSGDVLDHVVRIDTKVYHTGVPSFTELLPRGTITDRMHVAQALVTHSIDKFVAAVCLDRIDQDSIHRRTLL